MSSYHNAANSGSNVSINYLDAVAFQSPSAAVPLAVTDAIRPGPPDVQTVYIAKSDSLPNR